MTLEELRLQCFSLAMQFQPSDIREAKKLAEEIYDFIGEIDEHGRPSDEEDFDHDLSKDDGTYVEKIEKQNAKVENVLKEDDPIRQEKIDKLVSELDSTNRIVMRKLLQGVETKLLESAFNQYLSQVIGRR